LGQYYFSVLTVDHTDLRRGNDTLYVSSMDDVRQSNSALIDRNLPWIDRSVAVDSPCDKEGTGQRRDGRGRRRPLPPKLRSPRSPTPPFPGLRPVLPRASKWINILNLFHVVAAAAAINFDALVYSKHRLVNTGGRRHLRPVTIEKAAFY